MMKSNKLALSLLLSIGMGAVAAPVAPAKAKTATTTTAKAEKADLNTVIDVQEPSFDRSDLKIRYMDVFAAMRESKEGMEAGEKLDLKRAELAKDIEVEAKKYEAIMNEYKAKSSTMSETARAKKEQELVKLKRDYENKLQTCDEELKLVMQQVTEALGKEVELAVMDKAKKDGLDSVVDIQTGRVVFTSGKANCTADIVASMDKHYTYKVAHNEKSAASNVTIASNKKSTGTTAA